MRSSKALPHLRLDRLPCCGAIGALFGDRWWHLFTRDITGPATILECPDDQAAVDQAQQHLNGRAVEVWNGARMVVRLDPIRPLLL